MSDEKKSVFLFHGEDNYSLSQKVKLWRDEFIKKHGDTSLEIFDGKKLDPGEFNTNLETLPFLSEKRLIIVKDLMSAKNTDDQKRIADYLDRTPDFCIVLFVENGSADKRISLYKKIAKIGKVEEFPMLAPEAISKIIVSKAQSEEIKINRMMAGYIAEYCGPDLWNVINEVEKLKIYADGAEITKEMVDELCTPSLSASIFRLTDTISQKNTRESLKTFKTLIESGEDPIQTFFMIARHFRILVQVKDMVSKGENQASIIKRLGQHPFVIQKTSNQSRNFSDNDLKKIYQRLLEIDRDFKTGIIKNYGEDNRAFKLAIEKLIIDCCQKS